jgi:hypothetical protein
MSRLAQTPTRGPAAPLVGVVFNTSMSRPDAALALAAMYAFGTRRNEARIGAVCVTGAGLRTAIFCDIVGRYFRPQGGNANTVFAVGLAAVTPLPPDSPMVEPAIDRKNEFGSNQYVRSIAKLSDTAQPEALIRNGVTLNVESAVVLSAPATNLAKSLNLLGAKDEYKRRVKRLVVVDAGVPQADPAALRRIIAEWPGPVFYVGRDVGEALTLPGSAVEKAFAKTAAANPVVDAMRAYKATPYDIPAHDLAAMHFTVRPDSGWFVASEPGMLNVSDSGSLSLAAGTGNVRRVTVDVTKKAEAIDALLAVAATEPPPPPTGRGRGN